jgi:predicted permease
LQKQFPDDYPPQSAWRVRLVPLKETVVGNVRQSLLIMLGAVGLVLLIGCVNVANLVLARASARGHEMAVRRALGAARSRLTRQLLTESFLLSLIGGIVGLTILIFAKGFLVRLVPESMPRLNEITISWSVLIFTLGTTFLAGVIFGLAPALHAGRCDPTLGLKEAARGSTGSRSQGRTRRVLVVTEFALSLVLLIAAALLLRSFWDLLNVPLGFDPQSVVTVRTRLPYPNDPKLDNYGTPAQESPFLREILRRSKTLPGVREAAVGDFGSIPLGHDRDNQNPPVPLILEGRQDPSTDPPLVDDAIVTPEYFQLMKMKLLRGRFFTEFDDEKTQSVAVINQAMAQIFWPNDDPLGKRLKLSRRATAWTTVVGIVENARVESLQDAGIPEIYSNLLQRGSHHLAVYLRGDIDIASISDELRAQEQSVDATLPVFGAQALSGTVFASLAERRFSMEMVGLFALTALLLAALGVYGVISYMVNERTHEFGIRVALGAQRTNLLSMVLRQGLGLALAGAAVGLVGALIASQAMTGLLYGVRPTDPMTFFGVAVLLIVVALVACYIPARRAFRVDLMSALRHE